MKKLLKLKITPYNAGKLAEFLCRLYMRLLGYKIIKKNYKTPIKKRISPFGELDFIALKGKRIVFCEVKKRKTDIDFHKALTSKQQKRIVNAGLNFLKKNEKYANYFFEFDVFFVKFPYNIKRIKNAINNDRVF